MGSGEIHRVRSDGREVDRGWRHIGHVAQTHCRELACGTVITNTFTAGQSAVHVGRIGQHHIGHCWQTDGAKHWANGATNTENETTVAE